MNMMNDRSDNRSVFLLFLEFVDNRQRVAFHQQATETQVKCKKQRSFIRPCFSHERINHITKQISFYTYIFPFYNL
ncbi:hypothetical protein CXB51_009647 [Gossypium anomalum]|uniref:Uncharacterized protein n=1 Tax=Gossypium anomalum TaxID=47600 RepID=A0A8J5YM01_9ROSI|nr:hypothetical protein CXB51_009647 [Gossypium anomalum]